ncbi:MurR/RpiR family transcriptional regulator [Solicola gregarius]|uniref:MurR/RpiR family transcriptional regulator n=1 Tax=Solicola gregarius TaxID=2908642 RepID=A0AA46TMJ4_9ACTN|nr:MurR/RpiR family transcriptional regulator [Solicola gregarius]UYM07684.1 MurR/RpiR family transcriptional regulator [Solicola gregarius]
MARLPDWARERLEGGRVGPGAARVIEILELQPQLASYASTAEIAERAGVNIATVVRTAQALGFSGWSELRQEIRSRYLASLSAVQVLSEHQAPGASRTRDAVRQDLANLEALANTIDQQQISTIAQVIADADRTVVIGSGSFISPGLQLSHGGQTMGLDVRFGRGGGTTLFNEVSLLGQGDVVVAFSFWWLAKEVLEAARVAADAGATVILLTDRRSTRFSELADHALIVPSEGAGTFPSMTGAMTVINCVLAEIAEYAEPRVREAIVRAEAVWRANDLFD